MKIEVYSPTIRRKEMDAVLTAMVENQVGPGEHTRFLVHAAREALGFDYCLALRSPVFALQLALEALLARKAQEGGSAGPDSAEPLNAEEAIRRGRGVVISALSPLYYDRVIRGLGLVPVYCDTAADSPLMDREKLRSLLAVRPLCVVFHETLGYLPEQDLFAELGVPVIEDCSQSAGTVLGGSAEDGPENASGSANTGGSGAVPSDVSGAKTAGRAGSFGTLAILGLEEKDMITSGGGALLFAVSRRDAALLRSLGELPPEYLLPDVNAAMAAVQFREEAKNLARRGELAEIYVRAGLQGRHKRFREETELRYNNYAFSLVLESGVKDVKAYAKRKDIAVEEAFELTLAGSGALPSAQCPCASSLALRTVLFPLYPRLGAASAERVAKLITTLP